MYCAGSASPQCRRRMLRFITGEGLGRDDGRPRFHRPCGCVSRHDGNSTSGEDSIQPNYLDVSKIEEPLEAGQVNLKQWDREAW